jgi:5'-methylthioadenosine phosphorylase
MLIGIIGGSGLYQLDENQSVEKIKVSTPYGDPSGDVVKLKFPANDLFFIPRHGLHHSILPSEINYRANLFALKKLGCRAVISVSAVGSMREDIAPGDFVLPDQYIDRTRNRESTFFGNGVVAHAPFADPTCSTVREHIRATVSDLGFRVHVGGTYVCMEGPQFSTRAESHLYRSFELTNFGVTVIGMTAMPEAKLAREAGMCYQTIAMATDFDCWKEGAEDVSADKVLKVIANNVNCSRRLIATLATSQFHPCSSHCHELMKNAVVTPKEFWPPSKRTELEIILG